MAYTNNVPQGNQQIATTQPLIQANFGFIQTDLQVDHCFNGNGIGGQAEGTHKQIDLPNQAAPAIAAGCAGNIYANNNQLFWNSTALGNVQISGLKFVSGVTAVGASGGAFTILPAGTTAFGLVNVYRISDFKYNLIQFNFAGGVLVQNSLASGASSNINLQLDGSFNLQLNNTSSSNQTYVWQVIYT